jgi:hypothetical protein
MRMTVCAAQAPKRTGASSLCVCTGRCVPFSAVNPLCTSFPLDLRRIARSRAARVLVCVLALALTAANIVAAAMPPAMAVASTNGGAGAPHHASHDRCAEHESSAGQHADHARHGADCTCCIGKTCACVHACDALVVALLPTSIAPSMRVSSVPLPRDYAVIEARLLRPPIA